MDKFTLYAGQFLPFHEYFAPKGHKACQGCGVALGVRHVYKALEGICKNLNGAIWQIPWKHRVLATHDAASTTAPALLLIEKDQKNQSKLHICFDNECIRSKIEKEVLIKRQPALALASDFVYVATACPSYPFDLIEKVRRAWDVKGNSYIHILCPCPVGWEFPSENTVRIGRMAVETRLFPLYEIAGGTYHITVDEPNPRPLTDYLKLQKRFAHWKPQQAAALQEAVMVMYKQLKDKATVAK